MPLEIEQACTNLRDMLIERVLRIEQACTNLRDMLIERILRIEQACTNFGKMCMRIFRNRTGLFYFLGGTYIVEIF